MTLKMMSLYLELFKYNWDSSSALFKLNNPSHKEENSSFIASPFKMKALSVEMLGTTCITQNHIPHDLIPP
jgi:hypothetical protein